MPDDTEKRSEELYVVELDGVKRSEHRIFGLRGIEWATLGYEGARKLCIS